MAPKGISPLIATILLIAFVIAVGGILSGWLVSFSKERTEEIRQKGEEDIRCSYANLRISDADWNESGTKLSFIVENTDSEDLSDFRVVVIYANNTASTLRVAPSTTLAPGDVEVFYNETHVGNCSEISRVIFYSGTCPTDARDEIQGTDIDDC